MIQSKNGKIQVKANINHEGFFQWESPVEGQSVRKSGKDGDGAGNGLSEEIGQGLQSFGGNGEDFGGRWLPGHGVEVPLANAGTLFLKGCHPVAHGFGPEAFRTKRFSGVPDVQDHRLKGDGKVPERFKDRFPISVERLGAPVDPGERHGVGGIDLEPDFVENLSGARRVGPGKGLFQKKGFPDRCPDAGFEKTGPVGDDPDRNRRQAGSRVPEVGHRFQDVRKFRDHGGLPIPGKGDIGHAPERDRHCFEGRFFKEVACPDAFLKGLQFVQKSSCLHRPVKRFHALHPGRGPVDLAVDAVEIASFVGIQVDADRDSPRPAGEDGVDVSVSLKGPLVGSPQWD